MKNTRVSRRKEIIKIRAEINAKERKETIAKINKAKSGFLEKINKIDKPLARLIKKQRETCSLAKALGGHLELLLAVRGGGGRCAQSCAGLSFAWMFFVEIHLGAIS